MAVVAPPFDAGTCVAAAPALEDAPLAMPPLEGFPVWSPSASLGNSRTPVREPQPSLPALTPIITTHGSVRDMVASRMRWIVSIGSH